MGFLIFAGLESHTDSPEHDGSAAIRAEMVQMSVLFVLAGGEGPPKEENPTLRPQSLGGMVQECVEPVIRL